MTVDRAAVSVTVVPTTTVSVRTVDSAVSDLVAVDRDAPAGYVVTKTAKAPAGLAAGQQDIGPPHRQQAQ